MPNNFQIGPVVFNMKNFNIFPYIYIGKTGPPSEGHVYQWIKYNFNYLGRGSPKDRVPNYFQIGLVIFDRKFQSFPYRYIGKTSPGPWG